MLIATADITNERRTFSTTLKRTTRADGNGSPSGSSRRQKPQTSALLRGECVLLTVELDANAANIVRCDAGLNRREQGEQV